MAKLTLNNIDNESVPSASVTINANNDATEAAFENTLSRDGTSPNEMQADLDMNSYRLLNLPEARSNVDGDVVRVGDLGDLVALLGVQGPPGPTGDGTGDMLGSNNLSDIDSPSTARTNLGLDIGSDILGFDDDLQDIADLTWASQSLLWKNGASTVSGFSVSDDVVTLLEANDFSSFRDDLGLGNSATLDVGQGGSKVAAGDDSRFTTMTVNTVNSNSNVLRAYAGEMMRHTSGSAHQYTIDANSSIDHPVGTVVNIRNAPGGGDITLARAAGVELRLSGSTTNSNLTLSEGGFCTIIQEDTDVWIASGTGLS